MLPCFRDGRVCSLGSLMYGEEKPHVHMHDFGLCQVALKLNTSSALVTTSQVSHAYRASAILTEAIGMT